MKFFQPNLAIFEASDIATYFSRILVVSLNKSVTNLDFKLQKITKLVALVSWINSTETFHSSKEVFQKIYFSLLTFAIFSELLSC